MGIPTDDEDFDYKDFVQREFEGKEPRRKLQPLWTTVAVLILLSFVWFIFKMVF